jgi:hypothetical protein
MAGGGVAVWNQITSSDNYGSTYGYFQSLSWGVVTAVGASTITASAFGTMLGMLAAQFTSSLGAGTWAVDQHGQINAAFASPQTTWGTPPITASAIASGNDLLFVGGGESDGGSIAGTTAGFTYQVFSGGTNVFSYTVASGPQTVTSYSCGGTCTSSYSVGSGMDFIFTPNPASMQIVMIC